MFNNCSLFTVTGSRLKKTGVLLYCTVIGWKTESTIYISREVNIFSDFDAKELIQELKSISKMLPLLHGSLKNCEL